MSGHARGGGAGRPRDGMATVLGPVQQESLWAKVREEAGRGKDRFKIRDLADAMCSQAVLDYLSATGVEWQVPAPAEGDVPSEPSEREPRERREREEERRREADELGAGGEEQPLFLPTHVLLHGLCGRGVGGLGDGIPFFCLSCVLCRSPCAHCRVWDRPGRRADGILR